MVRRKPKPPVLRDEPEVIFVPEESYLPSKLETWRAPQLILAYLSKVPKATQKTLSAILGHRAYCALNLLRKEGFVSYIKENTWDREGRQHYTYLFYLTPAGKKAAKPYISKFKFVVKENGA